jgi:hypothetical protein
VTDTPTRGLEPMVVTAQPGLRGLLVVLGVAGAVVVAGLAVWLGSAPGETPGSRSLPDTPALTAEGEGEEATEDEQVGDEPIPLPLVTYELFLARDPFEPVVPEPVSAPSDPNGTDGSGSGGSGSDANGSGGSGGTGTSGGNSNSGGNSSGNSNGGCTGTSEVVCDGRVLTVIEVFEENGELIAVIQVDTMRYQLGVGDIFVDFFQVVSISPDRVRLLYGDSVVTIDVGDNALK